MMSCILTYAVDKVYGIFQFREHQRKDDTILYMLVFVRNKLHLRTGSKLQ